jgi:hypothetical protein
VTGFEEDGEAKMAEVRSLYDAIVKAKVKEDQCTNFLLWLLKRLPSDILIRICDIAELSITHVDSPFSFRVQPILCDSRPDGLICLSDTQYLIIETKRFANCFNRDQFLNHLKGSCLEYGKENVWCLFLSGDEKIPSELKAIREKYIGQVGFISWKALLSLLRSTRDDANEKDQLIIGEFLEFTKHYQLGKVLSMNTDELKEFMRAYPIVAKYEDAFSEKLNSLLDTIQSRIIIVSNEIADVYKDETVKDFPCIYRGFTIDGWHIKPSAYIYLDIMIQKIGVILIGYQDEKEKKKFIPLWNDTLKIKYRDNSSLSALRWADHNDDEFAVEGDYFKVIEGTSGKSFSPDKISEFDEYFYWGYVYDFDADKLETHPESISKAFQMLTENFLS